MRGVILAGGTGSRLGVVTQVVNKHVLPVAGSPMIYYPLMTLEKNGIEDITIVSTPQGIGQIAQVLGGNFTYRVQRRPGGIADALACAETRTYEPVAVILGDNIFYRTPSLACRAGQYPLAGYTKVFLKRVPQERLPDFGVPVFDSTGQKIIKVEEKPTQPPSDYAVTGLYVFSPDVFDRIKMTQPSKRGELEITDLLNTYTKDNHIDYSYVEGFWGDAGTIEGMAECDREMRK